MNEHYPPNWCFHHERLHAPMEWTDGCQRPEDVQSADLVTRIEQAWTELEQAAVARRHRWWRVPPVRAVKRVLVCWWRHRTRKVNAGTYVSTGCWACTGAGARP